MGWTFIRGASRSSIIAECVADQTLTEGGVLRTLRKCLRGNVMYSLLESTRSGKTVKLIGVTLLQRSKDGWGYKSMGEAEMPYYFDCPLSFLDLADEPANESSAKWRGIVRANAAKKPGVGETWRLAPGYAVDEVVIASAKPLQGSADGKLYSLRRSMLDSCVGGSERPA